MEAHGRAVLYRILVRCSEQWAVATAREYKENVSPDLAMEPFESLAWKDAAKICSALRSGYQAPAKFRRKDF
jgi:hypothetical protein